MRRHCYSQTCTDQTKSIPLFSLEIAERKSPAASNVSRISSRVAIFTCACVLFLSFTLSLHFAPPELVFGHEFGHEYFTVLTVVVNKTL